MWAIFSVQVGIILISTVKTTPLLTSPIVTNESTLAPPSLTQLPPSTESSNLFNNSTGSSLQESNFLNLTNGTPLNLTSIPILTTKENKSLNVEAEKIEIVRQANESLVSFLRHIEDQIGKQSLTLNETAVELFERNFQNLSAIQVETGNKGSLEKRQLSNTTRVNAEEWISQISGYYRNLLEKIHGDLDSLGKGFQQLAFSIVPRNGIVGGSESTSGTGGSSNAKNGTATPNIKSNASS